MLELANRSCVGVARWGTLGKSCIDVSFHQVERFAHIENLLALFYFFAIMLAHKHQTRWTKRRHLLAARSQTCDAANHDSAEAFALSISLAMRCRSYSGSGYQSALQLVIQT